MDHLILHRDSGRQQLRKGNIFLSETYNQLLIAMQTANKSIVADRLRLGETFSTTIKEKPVAKFSMNKSLSKGIKENDISKIIDTSNEVEPSFGGLPDEERDLHALVTDLRKRYDDVLMKSSKLNEQIDKKTRVAEQTRMEETTLREQVHGAKHNLQLRQKEFNDFNLSVEASIYGLDILKEMQARLKSDILVFKKRNFEKQHGLKKQGVRLNLLKHDGFNKARVSSCCREVLQEVQKTVSVKSRERTSKIQSLYDVLDQRHASLKKQEQRRYQLESVVQHALGQKLPQEKEWVNICRVNLFLKRFLKNKMERLIADNAVAENAYHQIKSRTDIADSRDFIRRFIDREKDYGLLLTNISQKENILQRLKTENDRLEQTYRQLTLEAGQILQNSSRQIKNFDPLQKQVEELEDQLKHIQHKRDLMLKWVVRFHCTYFSRSRQQTELQLQPKTTLQQIQDTLGEITTYTDHILKDEKNDESITAAFMSTKMTSLKLFDEDMTIRNNRVRTMAVEQPSNEADGASQTEFMLHNRRLIKKNDLARRFRIKTQAK